MTKDRIEEMHMIMVDDLVKDPAVIEKQLDYSKINLIHMAMGIAGEAGELLDAIKKHVMYNKVLDVDNVIEELGDLEFYMQGMRQELNLNRDTILQLNMDKLGIRYEHGYSDEAAHNRADKVMDNEHF